MGLKVFVDTDVVISSLISPLGAAYLLLNQADNLDLFVSNVSVKEIEKVVIRLSLDRKAAKNLLDKRFSIVRLGETIEEVKTTFAEYVLDENDAHILAGAKAAHAHFLISYNVRHFKADAIKEDFKIILSTPANFLQYLRSR